MFLFDEATHTYTNDGVSVPSVTQLLAANGLSDFSTVPEETLEYARVLGNAVHRGSELYELGTLDESTVDPVVKKRLDQWLEFLDFSKGKGWTLGEKMVEPTLYCSAGFAGRPDRIYYNAGLVFIPDIKTGGKTAAHQIQTAGYEMLARDYFAGRPIKKIIRMTVYLRDDTYLIEEHKSPTDAAIFRSCLNIYHYRKDHKLL